MRIARALTLLLVAGCSGASTTAPVEPVPVAFGGADEPAGGLLYAAPAGGGRRPALLVIHEDYGLTPWVKEQAAALAGRGYVVLAVDLYHGRVVSDVDDAHILERALPVNQVLAELKAAVDFLAARSDVNADAIGAVGWDIGGGFALDAAVADQRIKAVVVCYGRLVTDADALRSMRAAVLGIFAGNDAGIDRSTRDAFAAAVVKAGRPPPALHVFDGAEHYFMRLAPNSEASRRAWDLIERFLKAELKPASR